MKWAIKAPFNVSEQQWGERQVLLPKFSPELSRDWNKISLKLMKFTNRSFSSYLQRNNNTNSNNNNDSMEKEL
jgi:hypothetical protein